MDDRRLRDLVKRFWKLNEAQISDGLQFASQLPGWSSVRFLTFIAAVEENLGGRIADPATITSYAALRRALGIETGDPAAATSGPVAPAPRPAPAPPAPAALTLPLLMLGHDIEDVSRLPAAGSAEGEAFYRRTFTEAEIAYCRGQASPALHFAARFAVKEALQKCSETLRRTPLAAIEVVLDAEGRPGLRLHDETARRAVGHARILVSLSHTDTVASAVVLIAG